MPNCECRPRCRAYSSSKSTCRKLNGWVVCVLMVSFFRIGDGLRRPPRPAASTLGSGAFSTSTIVRQASPDLVGPGVQRRGDLEDVRLVLAEARQHGEVVGVGAWRAGTSAASRLPSHRRGHRRVSSSMPISRPKTRTSRTFRLDARPSSSPRRNNSAASSTCRVMSDLFAEAEDIDDRPDIPVRNRIAA